MSYESYAEWKSWTEENFGRPDRGEIAFYEKELGTRLTGTTSAQKSVLEIGFGNGPFLGWALAKNWHVYGCEVQETLRARAEKAGVSIVAGPGDLAPRSLDAVVAFDVFEHIEYRALVDLCRAILVALKPGGVLVARFPNGDSPFGMILQHGDPTHLTVLGMGVVKELMLSSGFSRFQLRAPAETPFGIQDAVKLKIKVLLRSAYSSFVRIAFLGQAPPPTFTVNYLLVAQKPNGEDLADTEAGTVPDAEALAVGTVLGRDGVTP